MTKIPNFPKINELVVFNSDFMFRDGVDHFIQVGKGTIAKVINIEFLDTYNDEVPVLMILAINIGNHLKILKFEYGIHYTLVDILSEKATKILY